VLADLSVTNAGWPDSVQEDSDLTYPIVVTNAGPDTAAAVSLADMIPSGTRFVSFSQTSGPAFAPTLPNVGGTGPVAATAATFPVGSAIFRLIVHVTAKDGTTITNTATVTAATADPNPSNNKATATHKVQNTADLSITKCDAPDPVAAGDNITYTIGAANAGPSEARKVTITDDIPANTTFVSFTQDSGPAFTLTTPAAGETGTVTATADTFASGASATFTLVVNVNADTPDGTVISNTVTISSCTCDKNPDNNSATATTKVEASAAADLSVTKSDSPDPVQAGSDLTYTIVLTSAGPNDATNVVLSDDIPANTTFVSWSQTAGPPFVLTAPPSGAATGTVTATADTFASGASATFTLVVNVNSDTPAGAMISNTATVSSDTRDKNPDNNSATATTKVEASAAADLSVTKSDSPDPVQAGSDLTYTIVLTSAGPNDATNVVLSDDIPANTTFVSWSQTAGPPFVLTAPPSGAATGTVTATADTFASGASATFTLIVNVNADTSAGTVISNTATVASSTRDQNTTNNSATEMTGVARGGG